MLTVSLMAVFSRRYSPRFFSGSSFSNSSFSPSSLVDQFMDHPFMSSPTLSSRKGWDMREDNNALSFRIEMAGLSKEDVKISVDQNSHHPGEGGKDWDDDDSGRRYSSRLDLPPNLYKFDEIKAGMKNGVLKIVVPKVKKEERKDVYQVTVE